MPRKVKLGVGLFLFLAAVIPSFAETMSVTVREAEIRSAPAFLSRVLATADYGTQLEVVTKKDPWFQLESSDGTTGWVHASALTAKRIVLEASDQDVRRGASADEVALAGRGFNEQVENRFKDEQGVDYSGIDEIEEDYRLPPETLLSFLEEGGLNVYGGGTE